jgi:hypothetical protein
MSTIFAGRICNPKDNERVLSQNRLFKRAGRNLGGFAAVLCKYN